MGLIAKKHASKGRYLFDTALWSLHPSKCFEAAMAHGSHVILVFPAGRIHIDQHFAASTFQLGDNARSLTSNVRKRAANDDIAKEDHIRKKQIVLTSNILFTCLNIFSYSSCFKQIYCYQHNLCSINRMCVGKRSSTICLKYNINPRNGSMAVV